MNKHKTIKEELQSWGKSKREIPLKNEILKQEILSKIPVSFEREVSTKRSFSFYLQFVFSAVAIFILLISISSPLKNNYLNNQISTTEPKASGVSGGISGGYASDVSVMPFYKKEGMPISDKREFLKISYDATLKTRHIDDLRIRIENIVHSFGGRIDSSNGGDKNGYINFVIPKDNLESFKLEIKDLVGDRFYNEQVNSENLLGDKQAIEENQRQTENNLNNSQTERAQIIGNHTRIISSFEAEILSKNTEINALGIEYQYASPFRRAEITNRISQLQGEINTIQSQITNENRGYQTRLNTVDTQIKNIKGDLETIKLQDKNLLENVATVNGSISLQWISLWNIVDAYVPGPLLTWIFFAIALVTFLWHHYFTRASHNSFNFS